MYYQGLALGGMVTETGFDPNASASQASAGGSALGSSGDDANLFLRWLESSSLPERLLGMGGGGGAGAGAATLPPPVVTQPAPSLRSALARPSPLGVSWGAAAAFAAVAVGAFLLIRR